MPHTIEKTTYTFSELDESAKETAREWWRKGESELWEPDYIFEDTARVAEILGIDLRQRPVKLMGGGTRYEPAIFYSGFWSQGDGACFEGSYEYAKGSTKRIRQYAPTDTTLHKIADTLAAIQRPFLYRLTAQVRHRGHYSHEFCTDIDVDYSGDDSRNIEDAAESIRDALRDFMRWIYRQLEAAYEWRMSDEQIDESISANGCEFNEDGTPL